MILVQCPQCKVLREGKNSDLGIVCLRCHSVCKEWHEMMIDALEDLALDPDS